VNLPAAGTVETGLYDMNGKRRWSNEEHREAGEATVRIPLAGLPSGTYLCMIRYGREVLATPVIVRR
jgi:hypothetical protein